jgi:3-phosphoglycerate kinase
MGEYVDFISTAGGAMLSYLGGEKMPGLEKNNYYRKEEINFKII